MKKLTLMTIVLCTCATFFCQGDTERGEKGRRTVEPRLSTAEEWQPCQRKPLTENRVVAQTECGPASHVPPSCDETVESVRQAAQLLASSPQCLDVVIEALVHASPRDNNAVSDRAAAYVLRAERDDEPADLLLAFEAADQAVRVAPDLASAWFNRASVLEALGIPDEAIASWDRFLTLDHSGWATEARDRRDQLVREVGNSDAVLWQRGRNALAIALRAGDRNTVVRLIKPFPAAAQRYFEDELLPEWATSPTPQSRDRVHLFAQALSERLNGDRFPLDIAAAIDKATPEQLVALKKGHLAFQTARRNQQKFEIPDYPLAERLLRSGGSPLYLEAARSVSKLDIAIDEADPRYRSFRARVEWTEGHAKEQTRFMESLRHYEEARRIYAELHDYESLTAIHAHLAGVYRKLGDQGNAWRSAFYASRYASHLIEPRYRHAFLVEAAGAATDLGALNVALFYQNSAVRQAKEEGSKNYLAIALRTRSQIQLKLQHHALAAADLALSATAADETADPDARRILQARKAEIVGQQLFQNDPDGAIAAFQSAYDNTTTDQLTNRVSLLNQLARAELRAKRADDAERHLSQAVSDLRQEQVSLLAKRAEESAELWRPYFSRFQDAHRLLIRLLMDRGKDIEAYEKSDSLRSTELLDLMQKGGATPAVTTLAQIQAALPRGTFLVQYAVLDDRVYAWIVSHDAFKSLTLNGVNAAKIDGWNTQLERAIRHQRDSDLDIILRAGFETLAARPLRAIEQMSDGTAADRRLVFIPDGGIHGLPIGAFHAGRNEYVIDMAPIEISGSSRLYLESLRLNRSLPMSPHPTVLAVGDPAFDDKLPFAHGLERLKFAALEAQEIQQTYMPGSELLVGADATDTAFLRRAPEHDIVHVAGHMRVNPKIPSHSLLMLAGQPLDAETFLKQLKFTKTRLVVFAACSSVGGVTVGPNGVAPMVRAALAGGVPGVVGSLWMINDATTRDLMVSFHRHYEASGDAALALQQARRDLLNTKNNLLTRTQAVFAWAPFQVIGHTSANAARAPALGGTSLGIHSSHSLQRPDRLRPQ
jgi:CHAT domain-containing protein